MKYRLTITPAMEISQKSMECGFETAEQMVVAKDVAAGLLLFIQDEIKAMNDYSNMFVMEEKIGSVWEEYEEF